ncbi:RES family NAD+ phosphorylase [Pleomorphomonas sp. PLEO]|uniref:RES family NAD+ phosphorylase n=1 Tax=Pleomorphomonas sp. PLEO TaxID=3239306 RepID=UPI00351DFDAA
MRFQGTLYRALNPVYAREPLSGRGAQLYGGRFNAKGTPALYLTLDVLSAIREANQVGSLQPTTLVAYEADIDDIFDSRDTAALAERGLAVGDLAATTWRDEMRGTGRSKTQGFAADLVDRGFSGLLVRSFARGSTETDLNLVLWRWVESGRYRLTVIDDEGRLG